MLMVPPVFSTSTRLGLSSSSKLDGVGLGLRREAGVATGVTAAAAAVLLSPVTVAAAAGSTPARVADGGRAGTSFARPAGENCGPRDGRAHSATHAAAAVAAAATTASGSMEGLTSIRMDRLLRSMPLPRTLVVAQPPTRTPARVPVLRNTVGKRPSWCSCVVPSRPIASGQSGRPIADRGWLLAGSCCPRSHAVQLQCPASH
jgi:hypothetical protein